MTARWLMAQNLFQHTAARRRLPTASSACLTRPAFQHTAARRRLLMLGPVLERMHNVSTHRRPKAAAHRDEHATNCRLQFQHTAARRRLRDRGKVMDIGKMVSTHSRPKAAAGYLLLGMAQQLGFNTQPPEGGCCRRAGKSEDSGVSTHSRPKAAAIARRHRNPMPYGFNTQPPEGGCFRRQYRDLVENLFQHTAARRRLRSPSSWRKPVSAFQHTAARRRLPHTTGEQVMKQSFNTQPPEGGCADCGRLHHYSKVSTHSRPKAAALVPLVAHSPSSWFQHTAARRRLRFSLGNGFWNIGVSTHSRPKAAAQPAGRRGTRTACFNTQPPEGGCPSRHSVRWSVSSFNTQPPEGGCPTEYLMFSSCVCFNTQPPEGGCSVPI